LTPRKSECLAREEQQPSHRTRHAQRSLAQPAQEAAPGLSGAGRHRFGIPSDLLKHGQAPLNGNRDFAGIGLQSHGDEGRIGLVAAPVLIVSRQGQDKAQLLLGADDAPRGVLAAVILNYGTGLSSMLDGRGATTTPGRTTGGDKITVRATVSTTVTGKRLAWEEEQPSHYTSDTNGSPADPPQEAAPGLSGAARHGFGIPSDLLKHGQTPLCRRG
jgi:hypothetical protein